MDGFLRRGREQASHQVLAVGGGTPICQVLPVHGRRVDARPPKPYLTGARELLVDETFCGAGS